ncbi:O-antigen ligase [Cryobacterium sp. MLB-32]|uniref:O-antigen ligase family protein n=1 Tax=Cryobacterium sp. MLB-32 TaxID=1529318 RepID=UPI0012E08C28|nr:O-antigen ligase family protein [Cryobacterium sp. MLB-32]
MSARARPVGIPHRDAHRSGLLAEWRSIALAGVAFFAAGSPDVVFRNGAFVCVLVLFTRLLHIKMDAPNLFAIALTLWYVLSQAWALDRTVTGLSIQNQLAVVAVFLAVRTAVTTRRGLQIVGWGYLAGCVYAAVLIFRQNPSAGFRAELSFDRIVYAGVNINYVAYALTAGLAVIVLLWQASERRSYRAWLIVCAAPLGVAVWYSETRGALLAVGLMASWIVLYRIAPPLLVRVVWGAVAVSAAAIATGVADTLLRATDAGSAARATGDLAGRLTLWPEARQVFGEHLLVGAGAGGFRAVNASGIGAHDVILELGTGLGLVGVVLFIGVIVSSLISTRWAHSVRLRPLLVGTFLLSGAPLYLSGHWELSPAGWLVLALFSCMPLVFEPVRAVGRATEPSTDPAGDAPTRDVAPHEGLPREGMPTESLPHEILPTQAVPTESLTTEVMPNEDLTTEVLPHEILPAQAVPTESLTTEVVPDENLTTEVLPHEILPAQVVPTESLTTEVVPDEGLPEAVVPGDDVPRPAD